MLKIFKFAARNLLAKKLSSLLLVIFLSIGFSILLSLEISKSYLENLTNSVYSTDNWGNRLIIEKNSSSISSLLKNIVNSKNSFRISEIDEINKVEWVKNIYKSTAFSEPAMMSINLLWNNFTTDIFLEWIEKEFFSKEFEKFEDRDNYIPLIVSEKAINSLLAIFVKDKAASNLTKELIMQKEFDMTFGKSTMTRNNNKSVKMKWKIVWFWEWSNFMTIWIPYSSLEKINLQLGKTTQIEKLFIVSDKKTDIDSLQINIENLWYTVTNPKSENDRIKWVISILYKIWLIFVTIILIIITYSLISFLVLRLIESKKNNSIMYALWIKRSIIAKIHILELFIISLFWLILSLIITYFSSHFINNYITEYNSTHNFINLWSIDFGFKNIFTLLIFFVIINIFIASFSCFRIWKSDFRKGG